MATSGNSGRGTAEPGDPVAAFAARLRDLQRDSGGPSVRDLESSLRAAGKPFSRSTINDKLAGVSKPSWEFVEAFVRACAGFGPEPRRPERLDEWRRRFQEMLVALAHRYSQLKAGGSGETGAGRDAGAPVSRLGAGSVRFTTDPSVAVPHELPPATARFTGRQAELAALVDLLAAGTEPTGDRSGSREVMPVAIVSGTAGVGKTTLAVRAAHRLSAAYPDGQVYLDLRGYHPLEPLPPARALGALCRSLGVSEADAGDDLDRVSARWRSLTADLRLLVVLDNAAGDEQLGDLLPGGAGCGVLVTSRDSLAGTVVRHGAIRVDLVPLSAEDARRLLTDLIGARATAEPARLDELAERCARLPLALRLAAEVAAATPDVPLAAVCADLADEARRLDLLDAVGDPRTGVRPVLSWSVRHLSEPAARAFRLLGAYPGSDFEAPAIAALCDCDLATAERLVAELLRAHLVQRAGKGRYGCHDLLRAYARELVSVRVDGEREQAVIRLLRLVAAGAAAAMDLAYPAERHRRPPVEPVAGQPRFADVAAARAWLDAYAPVAVSLVGSDDLAHVGGEVLRLAAVLWRHLDVRGAHQDAARLHAGTLAIARRIGDRTAEALGLQLLGFATMRLGRLADATEHFLAAAAIREQQGDAVGLGAAENALGLALEQQGRLDEAAEHLRAGITAARAAGEPIGVAAGLGNLARVLSWRGELEEAAGALVEAIGIVRGAGDRPGEVQMLNSLGFVRYLRGEDDAAEGDFEAARQVCAEIGDRRGLAWAHHNSANVHRRRGEFPEALDRYDLAMSIFEQTGDVLGIAEVRDSIGEAWQTQQEYEIAYGYHQEARAAAHACGSLRLLASALNGMGEDSAGLDHFGEALALHEQALALATEALDTFQKARALRGLAYVNRALDHHDEALRLSHDARALFASVGAIEATYLEIEIAALESADAAPDH